MARSMMKAQPLFGLSEAFLVRWPRVGEMKT
jgi:hypothetical protein